MIRRTDDVEVKVANSLYELYEHARLTERALTQHAGTIGGLQIQVTELHRNVASLREEIDELVRELVRSTITTQRIA